MSQAAEENLETEPGAAPGAAPAVLGPQPKVFGRYVLLRPLSRGGMGEVFLATSGELSGFEKLCVIKKVLPHLAEDGDFIRRFIDEAQVAIKLSHANIASVFEVGMAEAEYFLALEYVEGKDLRRMLARLHERGERMPLDLALFIVREVTSGLAYAHRRSDAAGRPLNLVHCDISPPNVLVSYEGEVKIIDFGIAKSALRLTATNPKTGFGKLGYMAPEQLVRGGVVDKRTDVYAAGVLLYELLVGERLFSIPEGGDYKEVARAVTQGRHPLPSHRDPRLYDFDPIVVKALAVDVKRRYQSAEELRDDVSVALARVNPTITGDRLGQFVASIFEDEMREERNVLAAATALDLSVFADELTDSRTHTVSFALAAPPPSGTFTAVGPSGAPLGASPAAPRLPSVNKAPVEHSGTLQLGKVVVPGAAPPRRGAVVGAAAVGAMLVGGGLWWALADGDAGKPAAALASADAGVVAIAAQPPAPTVEPLAPRGEPDAGAARVAALPPRPKDPPPPRVRPPKDPPPKVKPRDPPKDPPAAATPSADQVEAKFIAVKREYAAFRKAYGARLDEEWNDLLDLATYGRGDERLKKLSSKLDRFRQRMAEIKAGG